MTPERLDEILRGFPGVRVLVVGDLFLDKYLMIDPALAETSLETGLSAHQVVEIRTSPGAAGTVLNNLRALDVAAGVVSVVGGDGEGYDLRQGLERIGVAAHLVSASGRFTPTYTKPMHLDPAGGPAVEMSRLDHKNRAPLPPDVEREVIETLRREVNGVQAVVLADQVEERDCGVITAAVREEIARLAEQRPDVVFFADSRVRIGEFGGCVVKPNLREAVLALDPTGAIAVTRATGETAARTLAARHNKPAFLTLGEDGMLVVDGENVTHVPGVPVSGPTDPVGAGDSATAGIVASLCAGASLVEAATVGNLVASRTVQQLGTTGTTTRDAVRQAFISIGQTPGRS
jgi:rfaE bifunctional protein kinase chain/domain